MGYFEYSPEAFAITDFLSPVECAELIERGERLGFVDAPIQESSGPTLVKDARDNLRVMFDDRDLAIDLWARCSTYFGELPSGWKPRSLNERFRLYRYDQYQSFKRHSDGRFSRSQNEESRYTFMVYLNDDFEGGFTDFGDFRVYPVQGMALCFRHPLLHEGAIVSQGRKYVLRTDVMYSTAA